MNYDENEIDKILNSNKFNSQYLRPLNVITNERFEAIENAFRRFMRYESNIKNKSSIHEELEEYELASHDSLKIGDNIRCLLVKPFFFNIRLSNIIKIKEINKGVIVMPGGFTRKIKPDALYFRKLNKKDIVSMKLMEIINEV
jgi:hypothetical protein